LKLAGITIKVPSVISRTSQNKGLALIKGKKEILCGNNIKINTSHFGYFIGFN
jgi:hypothetical protein